MNHRKPDPFAKTVKIPVRIKDGKVEFFYGGALLELKKEITEVIGDLVIPEFSLKDQELLRKLNQVKTVSVLPLGTSLLVQMKVPEDSNLAKPMRQYLKDTTSAHREEFPLEMASQGGYYAEVILKSHLSMCLRGTKEATLEDCECQLLCLAEEAGSLNEAYTKLSTALEPHRRSHTGNAFQRVFYKENEYWRPLSHLRSLHQAQAEMDLFSESK